MKKLLLFSANVLFAIFSVVSGNISEPNAPTYLAPGAELKLAAAKSIIAKSKAMKDQTPKLLKTEAVNLPKVKYARINGTALDASAKDVISIDTLLVTSYDEILDGEPGYNYATIKYDKYGRRTLFVEREDSTRYTYTVDNNTRWLSRTIEKRNYNGWQIQSKEERTIENDKVKSVTLYKIEDDWNTGQKVPIKTEYYELEYGHSESLNLNDNVIKNAAITRVISYDQNGEINIEQRYTWVDKANKYFCTYSWSNRRRSEAKIFDDHITIIDYEKPYSYETDTYGDEYKCSESITYYSDKKGRIYIYYNEDGSISDTNCNVSESYEETNGDKITVSYDYTDSSLVPKYKNVISADYFNDDDYTKDFDKYYISYESKDGKWAEINRTTIKHHLLPNGLSEITLNGEKMPTVKFEKTEEDGEERWESYPVTVNDDNSYTVVKSNDFTDEYIYCYYLSDGSLQKAIWQKESEIGDGKIFLIKTNEETDWKPLDEYTTTKNVGGITVRTVYKTNSEGNPSSLTEYTTYPGVNGGKEFKSLETTYTYKAKGDYTVETYETYTHSDISKLAISEKTERITLEDGTIQITDWEYDDYGKGEIYSATRTETKDFLTKQFEYKKKSDSWELTYANVFDEIYTTEDGIEVCIRRELSEDQMTAINKRKTERKEIRDENDERVYDMEAFYNWDAENNKWIGDKKEEDKYYKYTFECIPYNKFDPIRAYSDEYMVIITDDSYSGHNLIKPTHNHYTWDSDKDEWMIGHSEEFSIEGDTLTVTKKNNETYGGEKTIETNTERTLRDSSKRIIQYEVISEKNKSKNDGEDEYQYRHEITYYTYNDKTGLLEEIKKVTLNKDGKVEYSSLRRYTYSNFSIETSDIETIIEHNDTVIINDRNVSAPGKTIHVYNLNGISISSTIDTAELPSVPGVYIIKAGNITRKVAVK